MTEDEANRLKEIEFYAANVNAWFGTRMEHDKSLMTLSASGVGLLVTLLSTVGIHSIESLLLYILSLIAFLVSLVSLLRIFKRNSNHLEAINRNEVATDPTLKRLDTIAITSFLAGVVLSSTLGIAAGISTFKQNGDHMSDKKDFGQPPMANDSFHGATNMQPSRDLLKKSFEGAIAMKPGQTPQSPPSQPTNQTPTNTTGKK